MTADVWHIFQSKESSTVKRLTKMDFFEYEIKLICKLSQWRTSQYSKMRERRDFPLDFVDLSLFRFRLRLQVVMVESPTYFNSTHPVLVAMKEINIEEFKLYREV